MRESSTERHDCTHDIHEGKRGGKSKIFPSSSEWRIRSRPRIGRSSLSLPLFIFIYPPPLSLTSLPLCSPLSPRSSLVASAFERTTFLQYFSVHHNRIHEVDQKLWSQLPSLKILRLQTNKLTGLTDAFFSGLATIELLELTGNDITFVAPNAFANISFERLSMYVPCNRHTRRAV